MKKGLIAALILFTTSLHAQTGEAAVQTAQEAKSSSWQNWTFIAVLLVTATAGVLVVSMDNGHGVPDR